LVHLYSQGYRGAALTNFDISLTNPSIIFEQEKVALLREKVQLAADMQTSKLFSSDYIYDSIFNLSEDKYSEMRDLISEDAKRDFRLAQIANEGNDPAKSGKSYGTPHDLASLYGRRAGDDKGPSFGEVPAGYEDETAPVGRPKKHASHYGTNKGLGGRDPLGKVGMKGGFPSDNENVNETAQENTNSLTQGVFLRNKNLFSDDKQMIFEKPNKTDNTMLNEDHIKDLDK